MSGVTVSAHLRIACVALALCGFVAAPAQASRTFDGKGSIEVGFSPHDDPEQMLLSLINGARRSVHVQAYAFTSQPIAKELIAAASRGVEVSVLADAKMNKRGNRALELLLVAGVPLRFETAYAAAHNKLIIVDAATSACALATGSYNFTWSAANRNAENVMIVRGNCPLVKHYLDNWQRHEREATRVRKFPFAMP